MPSASNASERNALTGGGGLREGPGPGADAQFPSLYAFLFKVWELVEVALRYLAQAYRAVLDAVFAAQPVALGKRKVQLGSVVAEGAYAFVYEAKDLSSGEPLAVKKLVLSTEEQRERAKLEIRVHAALSGVRNCLQLRDSCFVRGAAVAGAGGPGSATVDCALLAFPLYKSGTLQDRLRAGNGGAEVGRAKRRNSRYHRRPSKQEDAKLEARSSRLEGRGSKVEAQGSKLTEASLACSRTRGATASESCASS